MMNSKKELRLKYKDLRQKLTPVVIDEMSLAIANQILKLDVWNKTYFHIFLPIETQNEVNTEFILHLLQGKDKEIIISRSNFETLKMTHFLLTDNTRIKLNKYNIPEPTNGIEVSFSVIEVVLIPLLAFDLEGNRIGYGKGFYDKFLYTCNRDTIKIGISLFEPEIMIFNVSKKDVRLDYCVTPNKIYSF